jgi:flagellar hook-basal body complex protein FliE
VAGIPFNAATAAYGQAQKLISQTAKPQTDMLAFNSAAPGNDFAKMLAQQVQGVVDAGKVAETQSMQMVNGKADMVDVVTAMSQAEIAMETMVTVRDRVISAYEEIMRMPI